MMKWSLLIALWFWEIGLIMFGIAIFSSATAEIGILGGLIASIPQVIMSIAVAITIFVVWDS